jgi:hypothetical protein
MEDLGERDDGNNNPHHHRHHNHCCHRRHHDDTTAITTTTTTTTTTKTKERVDGTIRLPRQARLLPLPAWMADPSSKAAARYRVIDVPGNGDCLFISTYLCQLGVMRRPLGAGELRCVVADTMLDPLDSTADLAMLVWKEGLADATDAGDERRAMEHRHARPLVADDPPFSPATRAAMREAMLDPSLYWGDHYAAGVMARATGMQLTFVCHPDGEDDDDDGHEGWNRPRGHAEARPERLDASVSTMRPPNAPPGATLWCALLALDGAHYTPIVRDMGDYGEGGERLCRTAFRSDKLPRFVRKLLAMQEAARAERQRRQEEERRRRAMGGFACG